MKPLILTTLALATLGASAQDLQTALTQGKASLEIRTRYEYDEDSVNTPSKSATALTNRTILGYKTGQFYGVSANLQFVDVSTLFSVDNFNNPGVYGKSRYATIAEPHQDRILQGYLEWKGLKVGRQIISVDNQRFIGPGTWAQAPKSSTGATFKGNFGLPWMEIHAGHITDIVMADNTHRNVKLEFGRIRFQPIQALAVTPFYYAADVSAYTTPSIAATTGAISSTPTTPASSYQHRGMRADGSWNGILYEASYAQQRSYKDGTAAKVPDSIYRMGMVGYKYQDYSIKLIREALESGYCTPDAALHGFYGWSDRVSTTPAKGLLDTFVQAEAKALGLSFEAQYHWFKAESDNTKFGKELDFQVEYPVTKNFSLLVKFADYKGDNEAASITDISAKALYLNKDLRKFWLQTTYKF